MEESAKEVSQGASATVTDGGGALPVGWYVAYTRVHYERRAAAYIGGLGFATYVASQKEWHQWSDRRKLIDRIVIPQIVFVRCNVKEAERLERLSFIAYFLRMPGTRKRAIVPDDQIERLRFTLSNAQSSVLFTTEQFQTGDAVRVRFGKLAGLTGYIVLKSDSSDTIAITIDYLGCATLKVKAEDLEPLR